MAETGLSKSALALKSGMPSSTLTRFYRNEDAPLLTTRTMERLRATRDRIVAEIETMLPEMKDLPHGHDKRALAAEVIHMNAAEMTAVRKALAEVRAAAAAKRKRKHDPAA